MRTIGLLLWAWMPVAPFVVVGSWWDGVGVVWGLLLLAGGASLWVTRREEARAPGWLVGCLGGLWALCITYSLALAGSRVATDEHLPLYDLVLLVRPLVVVASDLFGPGIYAVAMACAVLPLGLALLGAVTLRRLLPAKQVALLAIGSVLLLELPGSRALLWSFGADVWQSYQLAAAFDAERRSRPHDELQQLTLADDPAQRPDVHVYVIESYGTAVRGLQGGDDWVRTLRELEATVRGRGWHTAAGVSGAPVHGGRSWIADTSVLTGLHVATQANYERATSLAHRLPTLPNFFRDHGYATVLVRPSDRARPGVQLQNRFGFQHTLFFEDIGYTGPAVGWGHIPDQFSLHVAHRDLIDPMDAPTFAFVHLCTSHLPWLFRPIRYDDPMDALQRKGRKDPILRIRSPEQELKMQVKRFTDTDGLKKIDRSKEQANYVRTVIYDLESIVQQVDVPDPSRPQLVVFYGDHQPPFLARGEPPTVPVHIMASAPELLAPFVEAGFRDGLLLHSYAPVVEHRDLFPLLARASAATR